MALLEQSEMPLSPSDRTATETANEQFFRQHLNSPLSKSWIAELNGEVVAVGTLAFFLRPPYPQNLEGNEAYLLNMFTLPAYRKRGAAGAILEAAMEYAASNGYKKVWLHATEAGRPLYAKAGFELASTYMESVTWQQ